MVQAVRCLFVLEAALVRGSDPFRFRAGSGALVQPASTSSKREASRPHPFFPQVCPDSVETRCTGYPPLLVLTRVAFHVLYSRYTFMLQPFQAHR